MERETRDSLVSALLCLGVIRVKSTGILILPIEVTSIRDVVWQRYIGSQKDEERWHSHHIDFFMRQQPSLRRCEELPWHLKKCRRWTTLKQVVGRGFRRANTQEK
eukprot:7091610-Ditylum_brightwellii.AAC.1